MKHLRLIIIAVALMFFHTNYLQAATDLTNRILFIVPGNDDSPADEYKPIPTQYLCSAMYWIWLNDVTGGAKGFSRSAVKNAFNMPTTGNAQVNQGLVFDMLLDDIIGPAGSPFTFAVYLERQAEFERIIGNWNAKEDFNLADFDTADEIEAHLAAIGNHL